MNLLADLQTFGYQISLQNDNVKLSWKGRDNPDPIRATSLLEELKKHKAEVIEALRFVGHSNGHDTPGGQEQTNEVTREIYRRGPFVTRLGSYRLLFLKE